MKKEMLGSALGLEKGQKSRKGSSSDLSNQETRFKGPDPLSPFHFVVSANNKYK